MRLCRLLVASSIALALSACARQVPRYAAAPQAPAVRSDLDAMMYGPPPGSSYVVRRAAQVVPMQGGIDDEGPYTLDSGDKLRIVVFGQDALSNNYTVDAAGQVTLPLIGTVPARFRIRPRSACWRARCFQPSRAGRCCGPARCRASGLGDKASLTIIGC